MISYIRFTLSQLDKALELYLSHGYNEDEDAELLSLFALIADINNEAVIHEAKTNRFLADIREDVFKFTRSKEVQQMILAEDLAMMDWNSNLHLAQEEAEARGIEIGEDKILALFRWLHERNRDEDFRRAATDPKYCEKLLEEYGLDVSTGQCIP